MHCTLQCIQHCFVLSHIFVRHWIQLYTTLFCAQSYLITAKPGPPMASTLVCTYPSAKKHIHPIINLGRKRCTRLRRKSWVKDRLEALFADGSYHSLCGLLMKILFAETSARGHGCMSRSNPHFPLLYKIHPKMQKWRWSSSYPPPKKFLCHTGCVSVTKIFLCVDHKHLFVDLERNLSRSFQLVGHRHPFLHFCPQTGVLSWLLKK